MFKPYFAAFPLPTQVEKCVFESCN